MDIQSELKNRLLLRLSTGNLSARSLFLLLIFVIENTRMSTGLIQRITRLMKESELLND